MQKKLEDEGVDDPEEKKELSKEEKEMLKRLEKGELDIGDPKKDAAKGPLNKDPKYEEYTEMGYEADAKLGLLYKDADVISKQRKVILYLIKSMGANMLQGKSIMNVSLPVTIFDKYSLLQRSARDFVFAPYFVEKMYEAEDPIEKLKYAVALCVAGLHVGISHKKPFNPVWGETYQCKIGDNLNVYCEQTSHHPPISHLLLDSDHYSIDAKYQFVLTTYPNSASFKCIGHRRIKLKDAKETTYLIEFPWAECKGFMFGTRSFRYNGSFTITDMTNKMYAQLRMNAGDKSFAEGLFKKQDSRNDFFKGFITKSEALLKDTSRKAFYSKEIISYIEGNWIDYMMIDGDKYWEMGKVKPAPVTEPTNPLPSDATFRSDLQQLIAGDLDKSQKEKERLEEIQRNDRKLREQAKKKK